MDWPNGRRFSRHNAHRKAFFHFRNAVRNATPLPFLLFFMSAPPLLFSASLELVVESLETARQSFSSGEVEFAQHDFALFGTLDDALISNLAKAANIKDTWAALTDRDAHLARESLGTYLFTTGNAMGSRVFDFENSELFEPLTKQWIPYRRILESPEDSSRFISEKTILVQDDAIAELEVTNGKGVLTIRETPPNSIQVTPFDLRLISPMHLDWRGMIERARPSQKHTLAELPNGNVSVVLTEEGKDNIVSYSEFNPSLNWAVVSLGLTIDGKIKEQFTYSDFRPIGDSKSFFPFRITHIDSKSQSLAGDSQAILNCIFVSRCVSRDVSNDEFAISPAKYQTIKDERMNFIISNRAAESIGRDAIALAAGKAESSSLLSDRSDTQPVRSSGVNSTEPNIRTSAASASPQRFLLATLTALLAAALGIWIWQCRLRRR